jgi:hypothetical protein
LDAGVRDEMTTITSLGTVCSIADRSAGARYASTWRKSGMTMAAEAGVVR